MDIFKLAVVVTLSHIESNYRSLTDSEKRLLELALDSVALEVDGASQSIEEHYQE